MEAQDDSITFLNAHSNLYLCILLVLNLSIHMIKQLCYFTDWWWHRLYSLGKGLATAQFLVDYPLDWCELSHSTGQVTSKTIRPLMTCKPKYNNVSYFSNSKNRNSFTRTNIQQANLLKTPLSILYRGNGIQKFQKGCKRFPNTQR